MARQSAREETPCTSPIRHQQIRTSTSAKGTSRRYAIRRHPTRRRNPSSRSAESVAATTGAYPRTKYEAELDLAYAIALSSIHCRLFERIAHAIGWLNFFSGSAIVVSLLNGHPRITLACGLLTTALSAYDLYFKPGEAAANHRRDRQAFLTLQERVAHLTLQQLDAGLARVRKNAASTLDVLERPVFNDNLRSHGQQAHCVPLTRWERFVRRIA